MDKTVQDIAVYGAGGFGLEVAMLIEQINQKYSAWRMIGFFDDGRPKGDNINGYPVLGGMEVLNRWGRELHVAFAIGSPKVKQHVIEKVQNANIFHPTLIHPSVILGNRKYVSIGEGAIICAGTIITTNITIGKYVLLNLACTVGHETSIGEYSSFMPTCNISGEVSIGPGTFWGTGAKVINRVAVGENAVIGAGAVVIKDVPAGATAVGVPAKVVSQA